MDIGALLGEKGDQWFSRAAEAEGRAVPLGAIFNRAVHGYGDALFQRMRVQRIRVDIRLRERVAPRRLYAVHKGGRFRPAAVGDMRLTEALERRGKKKDEDPDGPSSS